MKDHIVWLALAVSLSFVQDSTARSPHVQFDVAPLAVCRDVTTEEFRAANPGERLLEVRLEISTLLEQGDGDVQEFYFRVESPGQHLFVADYQPKTTLASDYAGNISVQTSDESSKSAGVSIGGAWDHLVKISGSGDIGTKRNVAFKYELHAPMEPVTASGTVHRGTGVYFKLRPSRQTSLEGSRTFALVLRAPQTWRGDYLQVHCQANGVKRGMVRSFDEVSRFGVRDFFVALYLAGDQDAKSGAERMIRAESEFRDALNRYRHVLSGEPERSVVNQFALIWKKPSRSPTSKQRIETLLFSHGSSPADVPAGLPDSLSQSLRSYLMARLRLRGLAGSATG